MAVILTVEKQHLHIGNAAPGSQTVNISMMEKIHIPGDGTATGHRTGLSFKREAVTGRRNPKGMRVVPETERQGPFYRDAADPFRKVRFDVQIHDPVEDGRESFIGIFTQGGDAIRVPALLFGESKGLVFQDVFHHRLGVETFHEFGDLVGHPMERRCRKGLRHVEPRKDGRYGHVLACGVL